MMTKVQLRAAVERFMDDPHRVVSEKMLCELAGISEDTLRNVFKTKITPITITTQIRLEKALEAIERGDVMVLRNRDKTREVHYRKKSQPEFKRGFSLTLRNGQVAIRTGLQNANSYRQPTFKEELER